MKRRILMLSTSLTLCMVLAGQAESLVREGDQQTAQEDTGPSTRQAGPVFNGEMPGPQHHHRARSPRIAGPAGHITDRPAAPLASLGIDSAAIRDDLVVFGPLFFLLAVIMAAIFFRLGRILSVLESLSDNPSASQRQAYAPPAHHHRDDDEPNLMQALSNRDDTQGEPLVAPDEIRPVDIPDPALDQHLRQLIGQPDDPLTTGDLAQLREINAPRLGIAGIEGLQECINVTMVNLSHNQITDIAPLASMPRLTKAYLSDNPLSEQGREMIAQLRKQGIIIIML